MWFYLVAYAAATIGAFAVMEYLDGDDRDRRSGTVDALAGLGGARPATAAAMAVCMFSLAGVPPLAGFWGKLLVFGGALNVESPLAQRWFIAAAVGGALNAAVAAAYYLRVVAVMYFKRPSAPASASIATVSSTRGGRGGAAGGDALRAACSRGRRVSRSAYRRRRIYRTRIVARRRDVGKRDYADRCFKKRAVTPTCPTVLE